MLGQRLSNEQSNVGPTKYVAVGPTLNQRLGFGWRMVSVLAGYGCSEVLKVLQQGCNHQVTHPAPDITPYFCAGTAVGGHLLYERDRVGWLEKDGDLVQSMTYTYLRHQTIC